jgi:DNA-binding LacI/PurR family transcriptional regulator
MVTMRDISVRAGVSRSTVSFVLNGKHTLMGVNEETRQRVLQTAEELGYRRNELARAVVTGKNRVLGFVVNAGFVDSEVVARILTGIQDEAEANRYSIQMIRLSGDNNLEIIRRCVELRPTGVAGIAIPDAALELLRLEMSRFQIPIAVIDSVPPFEGSTRILSDDLLGCALAIEHLASLGHRRIAYIGGRPDSVVGQLRKEGYYRAMTKLQLPVLDGYDEVGYWEIDNIEVATQRLFTELPFCPTAVFCADDKTAMIACRTIRSLDLKIPEDISVVGFADLMMSKYNDPPLTTIAQPFREMGKTAVRRLLAVAAQIDQGEDFSGTYEEERLPTTLILRRSTAPVKE